MSTPLRTVLTAPSEARLAILEAFAEASSDALLAHDVSGRITSCNRSGERIVGYHVTEVLGLPVTDLFPPHLRDRMAEVYGTVLAGDTIACQRRPGAISPRRYRLRRR